MPQSAVQTQFAQLKAALDAVKTAIDSGNALAARQAWLNTADERARVEEALRDWSDEQDAN